MCWAWHGKRVDARRQSKYLEEESVPGRWGGGKAGRCVAATNGDCYSGERTCAAGTDDRGCGNGRVPESKELSSRRSFNCSLGRSRGQTIERLTQCWLAGVEERNASLGKRGHRRRCIPSCEHQRSTRQGAGSGGVGRRQTETRWRCSGRWKRASPPWKALKRLKPAARLVPLLGQGPAQSVAVPSFSQSVCRQL